MHVLKIQLSDIVGVPLKPTDKTSLEDMIEVGLPQHLQALEEIGVAATKEYALEKNLKKMKDEWQDMEFELNLYRWVTNFNWLYGII